jgi:ADP-heptose:LPS heptosyltransferase
MSKYPNAVHLTIRRLGIGDTVAATALVRDLHAAYPDIRISIAGRETAAVFQYDPRIGPCVPDALEVEVDFKPALLRARTDSTANYLFALHEEFEAKTGIPVPRGEPFPSVLLGPNETRPIREPYGIVASGVKGDMLVKNWGSENFAEVIHETRDWNWIQVGDVTPARIGNYQRAIPDAKNYLGRTSLRDLIVLIAYADVVLCHVSLPMLLASAFKIPCVTVAGGRETPTLFTGLGVTFIDTIGRLPCCLKCGCMASAALPDKKKEDFPYGWLCSDPVVPVARGMNGEPIGRCMSLITPDIVVEALRVAKIRGVSPSECLDGNLPSSARRPLPVVSSG